MNTNKFLIGGIIGGIVYFFLGWVVWGMLLMDFMKNNAGSATGVMKDEADMVWWALIVGNLFSGLLLSYVISKTGTKGAVPGATMGAVVSLLLAGAFDFTMLGTSNIVTLNSVLVDMAASVVVGAIVGAVIGFYMGMGNKTA